ncbi:ankyrin repeat domain-containing protein [Endozoicomonas acroporae]|uniref:ankyrin repeat domain-containing protein n=1 Tax=Endozoicomonas acroporae TaxID=1701104 RepID=UPI000C772A97|nr:ankyrin repeat domain-containing protein [Endozoicomonas acroporae]
MPPCLKVNLTVNISLPSTSGLNYEMNQTDHTGYFPGLGKTCAGRIDDKLAVMGKPPSCDYPGGVKLADRTTAENSNMTSRLTNVVLQTSRGKETLSNKVLLERMLLAEDPCSETQLKTSLGFFKKFKQDRLVKKAVSDFFKNSNHFSPVDLVCDALPQAEQLMATFVQTQSAQRLYRKAVANNLVNLESILRKAGVDINYQSPKSGNTPIMAAARAKHWEMVSLLLDKKTCVDTHNKSDYHLLEIIFCARDKKKITDKQQYDLTLKVLKRQPDARIKVAQGKEEMLLALYAFKYAISEKNWQLCDALLEQNEFLVTELQQEPIRSKIIMDVVTGYYDRPITTKYLANLKNSKGQPLLNLNCKTARGETLLMLALKGGKSQTVISLLSTPGGVQNINDTVYFESRSPHRWSAYTYAHYYSEYYQNRYLLNLLERCGASPIRASCLKKRPPPDNNHGHSYRFGVLVLDDCDGGGGGGGGCDGGGDGGC